LQFESLQILYIILGFGVAVIASCLGFGGGFIITPALFTLGLPLNIAVGTSITQTVATAIISSIKHRRLGNVDLKLGLFLIAGSIFGVESGANLIQLLKVFRKVDLVLGLTYILIIGLLSAYIIYKTLKTRKSITREHDFIPISSNEMKSSRFSLIVSFHSSGIGSISIWRILLIGYVIGFIAGLLGVGGGFLGVPLLIYVIGAPVPIAIGTQLFMIVFSSGYGVLTHAFKENINFQIASIMLIGTLLGAWIGPIATSCFRIPNIRFLFGTVLGFTCFSMIFKLAGNLLNSSLLIQISQLIIFGIIGSICCIILLKIFSVAKKKTI
jgi:uncharacterized membrane protein YfcA